MSSPLHPLHVNIVIQKILSHLGKDNHLDLIKYRLVNQIWNDEIVRKLTKSGYFFKIPLRYGPETTQFLDKSNAQRLAGQLLENVMTILSGPAAALTFDTVIVDRDFHLAGVIPQWTHFLEIHGHSIRHIKFKIRRGRKLVRLENRVTDCDDVVSKECLHTTFLFTPNLESLDLCVRFSEFDICVVEQSIFQALGYDIPQLQKLTKIRLREPHGVYYSIEFLKELFSMAPNLTTLCIKPTNILTSAMKELEPMPASIARNFESGYKPTRSVSTFSVALMTIEPQVNGSLTSLAISNAFIEIISNSMLHWCFMDFPSLRLTYLELNKIYGWNIGKCEFVRAILETHCSTLVTLILGSRKIPNIEPCLMAGNQESPHPHALVFPPIMKELKTLEVNLIKFSRRFMTFRNYQTQFPVLENLILTGYGEYDNDLSRISPFLPRRTPGRNYISLTVKQFTLIWPVGISVAGKEVISHRVGYTFPEAEQHYFDA